ncbi:serine/threonine-protein kinase [Actinomadura montaniterrae]|uniref:non-specific serine/threonine protein kinase n=1 Tax=Actinomadura montaniterrae TaxID=1803903 RepID=A0A6L3WEF9_9ACTN|nr:serine/threonine-protein kinase [Actinomadura montaniterrae]KAB2390357.1 serine/threonine protein kinase [Actinomadura montaniterrae]
MGRHGRAAEGSVLLAGRYQLIEPVGRGGMAEVWCAQDVSLGRLVAVKLLDRVPFADPQQSTPRDDAAGTTGERIWQEARYAARLVHPNVVQIYDVAADGDRIFLIMELVPGRNLSAVLHEQGPPAPSQVADLGAQAARALAAAHAAGVVHGDVKPANLLLTDDGVLKLTDFGIARRLGPVASGHPARAVLGTAGYLAPELALGHPPSRASDLYALGCVLYELSTGQRPFEAAPPPRCSNGTCTNSQCHPAGCNPRYRPSWSRRYCACWPRSPTSGPLMPHVWPMRLRSSPVPVRRARRRTSRLTPLRDRPPTLPPAPGAPVTAPRRRLARLWPHFTDGSAGAPAAPHRPDHHQYFYVSAPGGRWCSKDGCRWFHGF